MKRILTIVGVLVLMVAAAGSVSAQEMPGNGKGAEITSAAQARLRSAQVEARAAVVNLQSAARALKGKLGDADARRTFYGAIDRVLDAQMSLADARRLAGVPAPAGGKGKAPRAVPQYQRYLSAHNETSKAVTLWVQVYAKDAQGTWAWLPAEAPEGGKATAYRLEPGQSAQLGYGGRKLAGSKIRFWIQWQGGEFTAYRTRDLWLVPEVEGGRHIYRAAAMQTYPLKLTP
jgi:hypothetical protein